MAHKQRNFLEYSVFSENLEKLPKGRSLVINTINQYSYCMAQEDKNFKKSLLSCDILLPDGIAIVGAMKLLTGKVISKIAGWDVHHHLLSDLNKSNGKVFYLGATEATLQRIKDNLKKDFPNVTVETYSPPFKSEFDHEDDKKMIAAINKFSPDVLFVGMTAPKQEKWVNKYKHQLHAPIICSIGAVFDFYAGNVERPNDIFVSMGLEWLGRLVHEPKRMWKRYLYYGPVFMWMIMKEKAKATIATNNWITVYPGYVVPGPIHNH